ncbi:hypothetical protein [Chryseobacterium cucumeris]|uniref:CdiA C-terminal domain-containing protein n=1 Tax=Chryseobacterium cucumeris TaxID=1813611 RepID=UPI003D959676
MFNPTEWVIPSAGFISKTSECDALIQNGAFFMELDAAAIMESIAKKGDVNPDAIGSISSNRRFALVYKGEIIAQGSRYDKAYQKVLQEIKQASYSSEKVGEILDELVVLKNRTKPSKPKNISAKPKGIITKMPKVSDDVTRISLELENEAAEILAKNGFDIEQNPFVSGVKNPDYKIEGKIFDCYSPTSKDKAVRGIWTEVKEKIIKQQTKRVVINLKIWEGDMVKLQKQFSDWAIEGLEEVMYITKEGKINHLIIKK